MAANSDARLITILTCLLALVSACGGASNNGGDAPEAGAIQRHDYVYRCTSGYTFGAHFIAHHAVLSLPDRILDLPQTISADGGRYSDGATTFWIKGDSADLEIDGRHDTCTGTPSGQG